MENFYEKIHKILRKGKCEGAVEKYMKIVKEENKILNEMTENSAYETVNKYNIKKYDKLYIQNKDRIEYNRGGNIYAYQKIYKIEDKTYNMKYEKFLSNEKYIKEEKLHLSNKIYEIKDKRYEEKYQNYVLAKNQTNASRFYRIYSWISNKIFGENEITITDRIICKANKKSYKYRKMNWTARIEYKMNKNNKNKNVSTADVINKLANTDEEILLIQPSNEGNDGNNEINNNNKELTIDSGRVVSVAINTERRGQVRMEQCVVARRGERIRKMKEDALKRLKERRNKIEDSNKFAFEKVFKEIENLKELTRAVNNLKWKKEDLFNQNAEIIEKIKQKKRNLNALKGRMNEINDEKNNILNAARDKGERIKDRAYDEYQHWFGKKTGYNEKLKNFLRHEY
jgi:hypothetical protein